MSSNNTIIAFLTKVPNSGLIKIANELTNYFKVFIFIDDNNYNIDNNNTKINYIQIDNDLCKNNGYRYSMEPYLCNINNNKINSPLHITSYDKFFYYFTLINLNYEYIWIIEDDVFIPNINNIIDLNNKSDDNDLVCANNFKGTLEDAKNNIWFWDYAMKIFDEPAYCSMVCACRLSKNLMLEIKNVINKLKFIPLHEFLYNTIAYKKNLKVLCPPELSSIVYRKYWTIEDYKENPKNLFHPLKDYDKHEIYRNELLYI